MSDISLIVTSIAGPNEVLQQLAKGCEANGWRFIVIGDKASPGDFSLEGCEFYGLDKQKELDFEFAAKCPTRHYARKNIGYLLAIAGGASVIVETDDDNFPIDGFWEDRKRQQQAAVCNGAGWVNAYQYFSKVNVWPRGFALDELSKQAPSYDSLKTASLDCPIQQGLADDNPDVDAVYRLVLPLPVKFETGKKIAFGPGSWCPFNSQNTSWWRDAFKLMYLPAYCSFRMTDIWRSFVAQRIAHENGWPVLFTESTMRQERNEHNLMKDFADEVPGYLNNKMIVNALGELKLKSGIENIADNLRACYEQLVSMSLVGPEELPLLDAWLGDIGKL